MPADGLGRRDALVLALLAMIAFFVRSPWFGDANADIDEQLYSLIGNAMTQGHLPFVDLWDRKPFGLFALYALAHSVGGPDPAAYQVLAALFTVAGAWMTYVLARDLVDRVTAGGAAVLYVLLVSTYGSHSGQSEAFHVPMMLGMALLVRDPAHSQAVPRALAAMLLGGIALQVKYTVLPQCIFFGMWALWGRYRAGDAPIRLVWLGAAFCALGLLPTALVAGGYAAAGYWDEFLFANFLSFFDRLPSSTGRYSSDSFLYLLPLGALVMAGAYAALRLAPPSNRRAYLFLSLWLLAALATVHMPATVYRYYYAALAPSVALFALPLIDRSGAARLLPMLLVLAGFSYLLFLPTQFEQSRMHRAALDRLSAAISPRVDSTARCLWVFDGPTSLYRLSGSCLPTRFIYPDHLNNALEQDALGLSQEAEVARILATRPSVIVTADSAFTPQNEAATSLVESALASRYSEIGHETLHERTIRVWALNR